MRKDPTKFRERFKRWKNGEQVYDKGTPVTQPQDKMDSLLDAGYQGPWGTYGYTTDDVSRRIQQRTQARNNHIADRLQAGADAIMLGTGLVPGGQIPSSAYFGARGIGNIAQGDYIGGAIDAGLSLVGPAVHLNRQMHKPSNLKSYFESNPLVLRKYDLSQLSEGELLTRFWNEDVVPRMKKALKDDGTIKASGVNKLFNNDFVRTRRIRIGEAPTNLRGKGYSSGTNDIAFNTNSNLWKDPDLRYGALAHELHHSQRANLDRNKLLYAGQSGEYTQAEQDALNDAYNFSDEFITKYSPSQLQEKGAVNTQTRAAISRMNGGVVGKQLNKAIDAMPENSIKKIISDSSAYGKDFVKSSKFDIKKVNKALKQVGQIKLRPLLLAEDGKDPTYNTQQSHLPEVTISAKRTNYTPTYGYWDSLGQQWSTFNNLGQRVYRGAGWEPDIVLKTPLEYENYRQALWKKADPNRTFEFSDLIRGIADAAVWAVAPGDLLSELIGKGIIKAVRTVPRTINSYRLYRAISNTTPATTILKNRIVNINGLLGSGGDRYMILPTPLGEFASTKVGQKAYYMYAPKKVDVLKLGNGRFRHEVLQNGDILSSGSVDGKFVSYGEPWREFTAHKGSALYEFPVGPRRGPNLMATDWKGRPLDYSVNEIYDFMMKERDGIWLKFHTDVENLGLNKLNGRDRVLAYKKLKAEKYPELLSNYNTSIHYGNQTVIPNERWNFDRFLKSPFYRYTESPLSGQVQTEMFVPSRDILTEPVPGNSINFFNRLANLHSALADFSYKGSSSIDTNSLFSDLRKRAFNDYVTGIIDNTSERLRFEDLPPFETYSRPITESAQEIFNNSTLKRFARNRAAVEGVPEQFWLKGAENALPKEYYMVPRKVFNGLGEDPKIQGLHFTKSDKILVPNDFSRFDLDEILNHEMRHSLDANYDLLSEESKTLSEAYDDLFTPEIQDGVHHPKAEMTTTNRDARLQLIGPLHSAKTDPTLQNKMIDKMSDEAVMKALYDANGYGKNATRHLGLLDSEGYIDLDKVQKYVNSAEGKLRVRNIRAAMKYVPAILLGMPAYKYTQNKTAKQIKQQ